MSFRKLGPWFLLVQGVGAFVWWVVLVVWPASRAPFLAMGAPDSTLFAFAAPDGVLFIGTAGAAAYGFWTRRLWAWPVLCVHAGAAGYAALCCWALVVLTRGDALLGAALMFPSLVVPGMLVWMLRPRGADNAGLLQRAGGASGVAGLEHPEDPVSDRGLLVGVPRDPARRSLRPCKRGRSWRLESPLPGRRLGRVRVVRARRFARIDQRSGYGRTGSRHASTCRLPPTIG